MRKQDKLSRLTYPIDRPHVPAEIVHLDLGRQQLLTQARLARPFGKMLRDPYTLKVDHPLKCERCGGRIVNIEFQPALEPRTCYDVWWDDQDGQGWVFDLFAEPHHCEAH